MKTKIQRPETALKFGLTLALLFIWCISSPHLASAATVGLATPGNLSGAGSNVLAASKVTMPNQNGTLVSISVSLATKAASPNNKYQVALYADANGVPGALIASSPVQTLAKTGWTAVPLAATLNANTSYWLGFITNGSSAITYRNSSAGATYYRPQTFGSVPAPFGPSSPSATQLAIYASYSVVPLADTTAPTVSLSAPANNVVLAASSITVSANASDNVKVTGVQFQVDGFDLASEDTSSPYSLKWNTASVSDGVHVLTAIARDAAGNRTTSTPVSITVDTTAPVVSGGAPTGTLAAGTTSAQLSVTTNESATCRYSANAGTAYTSMSAFSVTGGLTHTKTITGLSAGTKNYYIKCKDALGNTDASDYAISFNVATAKDTTVPKVSLTIPINGSTVSGASVTVSATASDNVAVATVQFKLDGSNLGSIFTSAPYSVQWDTTALTNGAHVLTAVATDTSGNAATSASVTITVKNTVADTVPPVISSIASHPTDMSATIAWTTNEAADTQVSYGTTSAYGSTSTLDSTLVSSHSVTFSNLSPSTVYHYRVASKDASGNLALSGDQTFTTNAYVIHLGILGDSNSDEFRADDNRGGSYAATTFNWVELLARYRNIDVGSWGTRSEPRRTGYEYDWARSDATAEDMITDGQVAGLAAQIAAGKVNTVVIYVGVNDFAIWNGTYAQVYDGTLSGAALGQKINDIVSSIRTAVDTVQAAGNVKVIVANFGARVPSPDYPDQAKRQLVTNAILSINAGIQSIVSSRSNVVLYDLYNSAYSLLPRIDQSGNLKVGDQLISLVVPGDEPHHAVMLDTHSGTVSNGFLANMMFIDEYNTAFDGHLPDFTDQEMLTNAGIQ